MSPSSSMKRILEIETSGNSSRRFRTTSPIRIRRSRCGMPVTVLTRSSLHEAHPVLADLHLVAVLDPGAVDPAPVDEAAVSRALVLDVELAVALDQHGVGAGHGHVVQEDLALGRPADPRLLARGDEALPRATATGAGDD